MQTAEKSEATTHLIKYFRNFGKLKEFLEQHPIEGKAVVTSADLLMEGRTSDGVEPHWAHVGRNVNGYLFVYDRELVFEADFGNWYTVKDIGKRGVAMMIAVRREVDGFEVRMGEDRTSLHIPAANGGSIEGIDTEFKGLKERLILDPSESTFFERDAVMYFNSEREAQAAYCYLACLYDPTLFESWGLVEDNE